MGFRVLGLGFSLGLSLRIRFSVLAVLGFGFGALIRVPTPHKLRLSGLDMSSANVSGMLGAFSCRATRTHAGSCLVHGHSVVYASELVAPC